LIERRRCSLDHLVSPQQQRGRDGQAEGLGRLEVDDQLKLGGLFDWEISGFRTLKDLYYVGSGASIEIREIRSEAHERARLRPRTGLADSREAVLRGKLKEAWAEWIRGEMHPKDIGPL